MALCEVCGNEILPGSIKCMYCGSDQETSSTRKHPFSNRCVNLELGKPIVEVAMERLSMEIEVAKKQKVPLLTFIHGYGSSGKGGAIRKECRKNLEYMRSIGKIDDFIIGERFTKKRGSVKMLLRRYPQLNRDKNLNMNNKGITLVIL